MAALVAGIHYPRSAGEFQAWFRTDADCLDYLEWLRWPVSFVCPGCGHTGGWRLGRWPVLVRRMRRAYLGDGRDDL